MNQIFYLKVNRIEGYCVRNLKHWLDIISLYENARCFILCDNRELKNKIIKSGGLNERNLKISFLESETEDEDLDFIVSRVTDQRWRNAGFAHLSTFLHAKKNGFLEFWNIDADDTRFYLSPERSKEFLDEVREYAVRHDISCFSLDMHASIIGSGTHWSFGITYIDGSYDWLNIMKNYCTKEDVNPEGECYNIDHFFRYLKKYTEYKIEGFYAENLKFAHYSNDFLWRIGESGIYHWKNGKLMLPIAYYGVGLHKKGCVAIDKSLVKFDIGITDDETTESMILASQWPNLYLDDEKR